MDRLGLHAEVRQGPALPEGLQGSAQQVNPARCRWILECDRAGAWIGAEWGCRAAADSGWRIVTTAVSRDHLHDPNLRSLSFYWDLYKQIFRRVRRRRASLVSEVSRVALTSPRCRRRGLQMLAQVERARDNAALRREVEDVDRRVALFNVACGRDVALERRY